MVMLHLFFTEMTTKCEFLTLIADGFSRSDELLMAKKVVFMKNVPSHANLVSFIGFIDESDGQG